MTYKIKFLFFPVLLLTLGLLQVSAFADSQDIQFPAPTPPSGLFGVPAPANTQDTAVSAPALSTQTTTASAAPVSKASTLNNIAQGTIQLTSVDLKQSESSQSALVSTDEKAATAVRTGGVSLLLAIVIPGLLLFVYKYKKVQNQKKQLQTVEKSIKSK